MLCVGDQITLYCQACGQKFVLNYARCDQRTCSLECHRELNWRSCLAICGERRYRLPEEPTCENE